MKQSITQLKSLFIILILALQTAHASGGSQFSSHVTVNTPARSYSHGVGNPLPTNGRRSYQRPQRITYMSGKHQTMQNQGRAGAGGGGYPRVRPAIPFDSEDRPRSKINNISPWQQNTFEEIPIAVLPPSPYKVDSPDPESLWPEGLFLPPLRPYAFSTTRRRNDDARQVESELDSLDPFLLEGSEAIAAVKRAKHHGLYFFHDVPHIESILTNQEIRILNNLKPHRLGSIRQTWPYNRP